MNLLVLDGFNSEDSLNDKICTTLKNTINQNIKLEIVTLRDKNIQPCLGCFGCWFKTPGECCVQDDSQAIVRKIASSDAVLYLTPITFGGYSSSLKKLLDKSICNINPLFTMVNGEMHHKKRLERYPNLFGLGIINTSNEKQEKNFKELIYRNSINMHSQNQFAEILYRNCSADTLTETLTSLLNRIEVKINE